MLWIYLEEIGSSDTQTRLESNIPGCNAPKLSFTNSLEV